MTRHPLNTDHLFMPISRREHFRRVEDFLRAHRVLLLAGGAKKRELVTLDESIREMAVIVEESTIHPLDEPAPKPAPVLPEQPLVPPGAEEFMAAFIGELAS